jgi:hypothetical protein
MADASRELTRIERSWFARLIYRLWGMPWTDDTPIEHYDNPVDNTPPPDAWKGRVRWANFKHLTPWQRGDMLLRLHLIPEQEKDWERTRMFNIRGADGKLYRITPDATQYSERESYGFFVYPCDESLPAPDRILAMKLHLEHSVKQMLEEACRFGRTVPEIKRYIEDYGGKI